MDDEPLFSPTHRIPPRQPQPGELLSGFCVKRAKKFYCIELRDRSPQLFEGKHNVYAQLCQTIACALAEWKAIEKGQSVP